MARPYKRWRLMPSFKPVEVEIVGKKDGWWRNGDPIDCRGKVYSRTDLFESKADAVAHGRAQLRKQQADLDKRQARITAKAAALDKAEAKA